MRTRAGFVLVLACLLTGCEAGSGAGSGAGSEGVPQRRSAVEVAEDPDATAGEIVAAGYPLDADAAVDGSRLVLYQVVGETSDVIQTAWRLYAPDGSPVTEAKGGSMVLGYGKGFWLGDGAVATDGASRPVPVASRAPRPGDRVVSGFDPIRALRPAPLSLVDPLPTPRGVGQGWTLDARGRQWHQRVDPEEVLVGSARWQRVRRVPRPKGAHQLGFGLTVVGDHVVLPIARPAPGENVEIAGVAVRRADEPAAAAWTLLPPGPVGTGVWYLAPRTFALDDRRYVVSDLHRMPYVLDVSAGSWRALPLPTEATGWTLEPGLDGLYALPPAQQDEDGADAWFSPDVGASWERLAH
jgi:hypothetical protein